MIRTSDFLHLVENYPGKAFIQAPKGKSSLPSAYGDKIRDPNPNFLGNPTNNIPWNSKDNLYTLPNDLGSFVQDPSQPNRIVKIRQDARDYNPNVVRRQRLGLSGQLFEIDHIQPLELGGADVTENKQLLTKEDHYKKSQVGAVAAKLYYDKIISLPEARALVTSWRDRDTSIVDYVNDRAVQVPSENALAVWRQWQTAGPKKVTVGDWANQFKETVKMPLNLAGAGALTGVTKAGIPGALAGAAIGLGIGTVGEAIGKENLARTVAEKAPDNAFGEFAKGAVSGAYMGHVPVQTEGYEGEDALGKDVARMVGHLAGSLPWYIAAGSAMNTALRLEQGVLKGTLAPALNRKAPWLAKALVNSGEVGVSKIKVPTAKMLNIVKEAGGFAAIGQFSKIEDKESRANRFLIDATLGAITGGASKSLKGASFVMGAGFTISALGGADAKTAFQNALLMGTLHSIGAIGNSAAVDGAATKMAKDFAEGYGLRPKAIEEGNVLPSYSRKELDEGLEEGINRIFEKAVDKGWTEAETKKEIQKLVISLNQLKNGGLGIEGRETAWYKDWRSIVLRKKAISEDGTKLSTEFHVPDEAKVVGEALVKLREASPRGRPKVDLDPELEEIPLTKPLSKKQKTITENDTEVVTRGVAGNISPAVAEDITAALQDGLKPGSEVFLVRWNSPEFVNYMLRQQSKAMFAERYRNPANNIKVFYRSPSTGVTYDLGFIPSEGGAFRQKADMPFPIDVSINKDSYTDIMKKYGVNSVPAEVAAAGIALDSSEPFVRVRLTKGDWEDAVLLHTNTNATISKKVASTSSAAKTAAKMKKDAMDEYTARMEESSLDDTNPHIPIPGSKPLNFDKPLSKADIEARNKLSDEVYQTDTPDPANIIEQLFKPKSGSEVFSFATLLDFLSVSSDAIGTRDPLFIKEWGDSLFGVVFPDKLLAKLSKDAGDIKVGDWLDTIQKYVDNGKIDISTRNEVGQFERGPGFTFKTAYQFITGDLAEFYNNLTPGERKKLRSVKLVPYAEGKGPTRVSVDERMNGILEPRSPKTDFFRDEAQGFDPEAEFPDEYSIASNTYRESLEKEIEGEMAVGEGLPTEAVDDEITDKVAEAVVNSTEDWDLVPDDALVIRYNRYQKAMRDRGGVAFDDPKVQNDAVSYTEMTKRIRMSPKAQGEALATKYSDKMETPGSSKAEIKAQLLADSYTTNSIEKVIEDGFQVKRHNMVDGKYVIELAPNSDRIIRAGKGKVGKKGFIKKPVLKAPQAWLTVIDNLKDSKDKIEFQYREGDVDYPLFVRVGAEGKLFEIPVMEERIIEMAKELGYIDEKTAKAGRAKPVAPIVSKEPIVEQPVVSEASIVPEAPEVLKTEVVDTVKEEFPRPATQLTTLPKGIFSGKQFTEAEKRMGTEVITTKGDPSQIEKPKFLDFDEKRKMEDRARKELEEYSAKLNEQSVEEEPESVYYSEDEKPDSVKEREEAKQVDKGFTNRGAEELEAVETDPNMIDKSYRQARKAELLDEIQEQQLEVSMFEANKKKRLGLISDIKSMPESKTKQKIQEEILSLTEDIKDTYKEFSDKQLSYVTKRGEEKIMVDPELWNKFHKLAAWDVGSGSAGKTPAKLDNTKTPSYVAGVSGVRKNLITNIVNTKNREALAFNFALHKALKLVFGEDYHLDKNLNQMFALNSEFSEMLSSEFKKLGSVGRKGEQSQPYAVARSRKTSPDLRKDERESVFDDVKRVTALEELIANGVKYDPKATTEELERLAIQTREETEDLYSRGIFHSKEKSKDLEKQVKESEIEEIGSYGVTKPGEFVKDVTNLDDTLVHLLGEEVGKVPQYSIKEGAPVRIGEEWDIPETMTKAPSNAPGSGARTIPETKGLINDISKKAGGNLNIDTRRAMDASNFVLKLADYYSKHYKNSPGFTPPDFTSSTFKSVLNGFRKDKASVDAMLTEGRKQAARELQEINSKIKKPIIPEPPKMGKSKDVPKASGPAKKIIIAGSRSLSPSIEEIQSAMDKFGIKPDSIISGTAAGTDKAGEAWAKKNGINLIQMPADWTKGKGAGFIRNADMAKAGDEVLVFWDGQSKGTENMIQQMEKLGKKVHLVKIEAPVAGWARKSDKGYEVSTKGDKRFSAFNAKLKDGRTIEQAYQVGVKGYSSITEGKGKPPKISMTKEELYNKYLALWKQWAKENPALVQELKEKSKGKVLTDMFANTEVNQARALSEIIKDKP